MLQWGRISGTGQKKRLVYMSLPYKDTGYCVFFGIEVGDDNAVQTLYALNKATTYFYAVGAFINTVTGTNGFPGEPFYWFAIGRWK